jgi:rod shape-determining protein MreB and related proteins
MLRTVVGIDLGTANTVFATPQNGIVLNEPSVIALTKRNAALEIFAVGDVAKKMIGKAPASVEVYTPLREGVIANFDMAEKMIDFFFKKVFPSRRFVKPSVVVCVPYGATAVEKRAIQQTILNAGAAKVGLIEEPLAAALGAELPIFLPKGSMIVDIGGGTVEIAIISLGGIVVAKSLRLGGNDFDAAIVEAVKKKLGLSIGIGTAERIKLAVANARADNHESGFLEIAGLGAFNGLPTSVLTNSSDYREAIGLLINRIEAAITSVLEKAPPDLASDIHAETIYLTGGGALLTDLDVELSLRLGIKVQVVNNPMYSVAFGAASAIQLGSKFSHAIQYEI